jgi:hypothetical protein
LNGIELNHCCANPEKFAIFRSIELAALLPYAHIFSISSAKDQKRGAIFVRKATIVETFPKTENNDYLSGTVGKLF